MASSVSAGGSAADAASEAGSGGHGRPPVNLDSWAMRIETLAGLGDAVGKDVDLVLGELPQRRNIDVCWEKPSNIRVFLGHAPQA